MWNGVPGMVTENIVANHLLSTVCIDDAEKGRKKRAANALAVACNKEVRVSDCIVGALKKLLRDCIGQRLMLMIRELLCALGSC